MIRKQLLGFFVALLTVSPASADGFMDSPVVAEPLKVIWNVDGSMSFPATVYYPGRNNNTYIVHQAMPSCNEALRTDCIKSISVLNGTSWADATFVEYLPVTWSGDLHMSDDYERDAARFIPASRQSSLWRIPGMKHGGGDLFMVTAQLAAEMSNQSQPLAPASVADWQAARFSIEPVKIHIGGLITDQNDPARIICLSHIVSNYVCIERFDFETFPRLRMLVNLDLTKGLLNYRHWFAARALDAAAISTKESDGTLTLRLEGSPTTVIEASAAVPRNREGYAEHLAAINAGYVDSGVSNKPEVPTEEGYQQFLRVSTHSQSGEMANFAYWSHLEARYPISVHRQVTIWRFMPANITQSDANWLWRCAPSGDVSGVAASNANILRPGPPTWDASTQTLRFKVASPHLDKEGKQTVGFYDLVLSQKVAACLWGQNLTQAKATVEVTDQSGQAQVATTVFSIKDGLVHFQAAGFHYSVSAISISLKVPALSTSEKSTLNGSIQVRTFTSCKEMWTVFASGIKKSASVKDRQGRAKGNAVVNKLLYTANLRLDTDKDGWVCER